MGLFLFKPPQYLNLLSASQIPLYLSWGISWAKKKETSFLSALVTPKLSNNKFLELLLYYLYN